MTPGTEIDKLAYCGLYCGACPLYLATRAGTLDSLVSHGMGAEHLRCLGCRSEKVSVYCLNCSLKKCAAGQGLVSCADCADFPCRALRAFERDGVPHHRGVVDALQECRAAGLEAWLRAQAARNTCVGCGGPLSFHDERCPACGLARTKQLRD